MECHHAGMDPGMVAIPCPSCQASSESASPGQTHWSCPACRRSYFLRRCSACHMVSHVSALQGWHQQWGCVWCHAANTGFSQHRDAAAATVADLAADVAGHGLRFGAGEPDQTTQPFPALPMTPAPADHVVPPAPGGLGQPGGPASPELRRGQGHPLAEGMAASQGSAAQEPPPAPGLRRRRPGAGRGAAAVRAAGAGWPRLSWPGPRMAAVAVAVLALVVLVVAVGELSQGGPGAAARAGSSPGSRAVAVTASAVGTVDLRGVPGLLTSWARAAARSG